MTKETTLNELGEMLEHVVKHMATKDDVERIINERMSSVATNEQLIVVQTQVNSIESQLRDMRHGKLEVRVGDLEEEVFGEIRS